MNQNILFDALERSTKDSNLFAMEGEKDVGQNPVNLHDVLNIFAAHTLLGDMPAATSETVRTPHRTGSLTSALLSPDSLSLFSSPEPEIAEVPAEIIHPLAEWSLLYGIPYRYLVPHKNLLPPESIRFFHLDHNWLTAMLDGAMSLGRFFDTDFQCDSELINKIITQVYLHELEVRPKRQWKNGEELERLILERNASMCKHFKVSQQYMSVEEAVCAENTGFLSTGFLLRSDLVKGWRGLEFRAYADPEGKTKPLTALRLETISHDVLLGIYIGKISCLEVMQPPEGMHMGFEHSPGGGYRKMLRNPENGALYDKECLYADVIMRNEKYGVMDWNATAGQIHKMLPQIPSVHSAYMALEMIQNPATGIVQLLNH